MTHTLPTNYIRVVAASDDEKKGENFATRPVPWRRVLEAADLGDPDAVWKAVQLYARGKLPRRVLRMFEPIIVGRVWGLTLSQHGLSVLGLGRGAGRPTKGIGMEKQKARWIAGLLEEIRAKDELSNRGEQDLRRYLVGALTTAASSKKLKSAIAGRGDTGRPTTYRPFESNLELGLAVGDELLHEVGRNVAFEKIARRLRLRPAEVRRRYRDFIGSKEYLEAGGQLRDLRIRIYCNRTPINRLLHGWRRPP